jgi:dihydrofolate synthase/folylpolyglutamate synthase
MGLENITFLCNELGNPQKSYPIIHIAGTNGKGSTSVIINGILMSHGLKVGLYTSPHLIDFRERIRVNNNLIEKKHVFNYWVAMKKKVDRKKATFFDTTTALAFNYFAQSKVDVSIIETGLGGRLDSTNIIKPVASVITPIAMDHIKQLGKNLKSIANEKAVIVKKGCTFFSANQKRTVRELLQIASLKAEAFYTLSESVSVSHKVINKTYSQYDLLDKTRKIKITNICLNLAGEFQIANACLAYLVSRWYLDKIGITFSEEIFKDTLRKIEWQGRLQMVSKDPTVILDVSHNYSGFKASINFISGISDIGNRALLLGLLDDKEYKQIVRLLSKYFRKVFLTEPAHERAIPVSTLSQEFLKHGIQTVSESSIIPAYQKALKDINKNEQLFVMGSHFIVGEILKVIKKKNLTR